MHAAFASFTFVTGVIPAMGDIVNLEPVQHASERCRQAAGHAPTSLRLRFHAYKAFSRGPR